MPTTGSGKFPYPNSSAVPDVPADVLLLAQRIDKISSGWTVCADATGRAALVTNSDAYEGLHVYQIDTKATYVYKSSAWVREPGLVYPTSVAGTGASLSGAVVSASSATSISVNGCFTTDFFRYEIGLDLTCSGAAVLGLVMRASGSNASTAYDEQHNATVNASNFPGQALNGSSIPLNAQAFAGKINGEIKLWNPATAVATTGLAIIGGQANPMTTSAALIQPMTIQHRTATAYDGFTITPSTGNLTGTVTIRGIA